MDTDIVFTNGYFRDDFKGVEVDFCPERIWTVLAEVAVERYKNCPLFLPGSCGPVRVFLRNHSFGGRRCNSLEALCHDNAPDYTLLLNRYFTKQLSRGGFLFVGKNWELERPLGLINKFNVFKNGACVLFAQSSTSAFWSRSKLLFFSLNLKISTQHYCLRGTFEMNRSSPQWKTLTEMKPSRQ